ncbi:MAG: GNAT family N-acetyltransferase [Magnetococcales bacterium]|nr:GNAT family N-acetyltransferase [Magnetococcales bacterium]
MLRGEWVGLRAVERGDLSQLLIWRNQPEFRRYFREYRELSNEHQQRWFDSMVMGDPGTRMFAIEELATGRLLGACGLCYIDWVNRTADFSIYIGADGVYIDTRHAPDAARVLIRYGFDELNLHRLWSEIYAFDAQKQHFFDSLGFALDGRHRQTHWSEGRWHDSLYYSLLAEDERK